MPSCEATKPADAAAKMKRAYPMLAGRLEERYVAGDDEDIDLRALPRSHQREGFHKRNAARS